MRSASGTQSVFTKPGGRREMQGREPMRGRPHFRLVQLAPGIEPAVGAYGEGKSIGT